MSSNTQHALAPVSCALDCLLILRCYTTPATQPTDVKVSPGSPWVRVCSKAVPSDAGRCTAGCESLASPSTCSRCSGQRGNKRARNLTRPDIDHAIAATWSTGRKAMQGRIQAKLVDKTCCAHKNGCLRSRLKPPITTTVAQDHKQDHRQTSTGLLRIGTPQNGAAALQSMRPSAVMPSMEEYPLRKALRHQVTSYCR